MQGGQRVHVQNEPSHHHLLLMTCMVLEGSEDDGVAVLETRE